MDLTSLSLKGRGPQAPGGQSWALPLWTWMAVNIWAHTCIWGEGLEADSAGCRVSWFDRPETEALQMDPLRGRGGWVCPRHQVEQVLINLASASARGTGFPCRWSLSRTNMLQHMLYSFLGSLINLVRLLYLPFLPQGYEANCSPLLTDAPRLGVLFHQKLASEEGRCWVRPVLCFQEEVAGRGGGGEAWGLMGDPTLATILYIYNQKSGERVIETTLFFFFNSCVLFFSMHKTFQLDTYPVLRILGR